MVDDIFGSLVQGTKSLINHTKNHATRAVKKPVDRVDLNLLSIAVCHGCMGLPQELVDHIMDMLQDDIQTLKACSLVCRAMFASARQLVHYTLYLSARNGARVLTKGQSKGVFEDDLRFLSHMGERGLLKYTRRVHIRLPTFNPQVLLPHLRHFQSLDRVHTLIIERIVVDCWTDDHKICFSHFYSTLTSLTLDDPLGHFRLLLRFALKFPNLKNLCFQWIVNTRRPLRNRSVLKVPFRGHLRLAGYYTVSQWLEDFEGNPPGGINPRSIELETAHEGVQIILDWHAETLQSVTIVPSEPNRFSSLRLGLEKLTLLRRLVYRVEAGGVLYFRRAVLLPMLTTIMTPAFGELVLEFVGLSLRYGHNSWVYWGSWKEIDEFLEERFAKHGDFRLIIRVSEIYNQGKFRRQAGEAFPSLMKRGCLHFEALD